MLFRGKQAQRIAPTLVLAALTLTACNNPLGENAPVIQGRKAPPSQTATADFSGGQIGKTASGFILPDADGKPTDFNAVLGTKPVVLVFYRGVW